jgi:hypothetical protein
MPDALSLERQEAKRLARNAYERAYLAKKRLDLEWREKDNSRKRAQRQRALSGLSKISANTPSVSF